MCVVRVACLVKRDLHVPQMLNDFLITTEHSQGCLNGITFPLYLQEWGRGHSIWHWNVRTKAFCLFSRPHYQTVHLSNVTLISDVSASLYLVIRNSFFYLSTRNVTHNKYIFCNAHVKTKFKKIPMVCPYSIIVCYLNNSNNPKETRLTLQEM